ASILPFNCPLADRQCLDLDPFPTDQGDHRSVYTQQLQRRASRGFSSFSFQSLNLRPLRRHYRSPRLLRQSSDARLGQPHAKQILQLSSRPLERHPCPHPYHRLLQARRQLPRQQSQLFIQGGKARLRSAGKKRKSDPGVTADGERSPIPGAAAHDRSTLHCIEDSASARRSAHPNASHLRPEPNPPTSALVTAPIARLTPAQFRSMWLSDAT